MLLRENTHSNDYGNFSLSLSYLPFLPCEKNWNTKYMGNSTRVENGVCQCTSEFNNSQKQWPIFCDEKISSEIVRKE